MKLNTGTADTCRRYLLDEGRRLTQGFGAHTRTIQARHVVRGLMSETSLVGISDDKDQQIKLPTHKITVPVAASSHVGSYLRIKTA